MHLCTNIVCAVVGLKYKDAPGADIHFPRHWLPMVDFTHVDQTQTRWESRYKFAIPEFHGSRNCKAFLDWL